MVNIKIQFNNQILTLPVNPENFNPEQAADNEKVKIIGLGDISIKGDAGLRSVSIESFFPSKDSSFYTGVQPKTCIDFINMIWKSDKVARITTEGLPSNINMFFVIDNFNPDSRAGEEDDVYYTLDITEYRPYGARYVNMRGVTNNAIVGSAPRVDTKPIIERTYTVISGDYLILITKKLIGDTSRWRELYEANKTIIGNNPDLIYPGTVLTLPESWVNR